MAPHRHTEFCGCLADGEERHERTIDILDLGNFPLLASQAMYKSPHPIIYILLITVLLLSMVGNNHPL